MVLLPIGTVFVPNGINPRGSPVAEGCSVVGGNNFIGAISVEVVGINFCGTPKFRENSFCAVFICCMFAPQSQAGKLFLLFFSTLLN